ncbi:MAG TPA: hypothetical protein VL946_11740, partial [Lacibacter sp.]|nr:hypothetical protein [Lacibacter sp.]
MWRRFAIFYYKTATQLLLSLCIPLSNMRNYFALSLLCFLPMFLIAQQTDSVLFKNTLTLQYL